MIKYFSDKLANYLMSNNSISENDKSFYQYGFEITLSTVLNVVLILTISAALGSIIEGVIFLITFITIRHLTGGYHAKSYFSCNFWFSICFISLELLFNYTYDKITITFSAVMIGLCLLIIAIRCPVENTNKKIPSENRLKLKVWAILLAAVYGFFALFLQVLSNKYGVFIVYTILLVAILVIVATLPQIWKGGRNNGGNT